MTTDEFLDWQDSESELHELVDGRPVPRGPWRIEAGAWTKVSGHPQVHSVIITNAMTALATRLRDRPERVMTPALAFQSIGGNVRRADVGVDAGQFDPDARIASSPALLVEVLSDLSRDFDAFARLEEYRAIPDLMHIVLLDGAGEASVWTREPQGWTNVVVRSPDVVELPALSLSIGIKDLIDGD